MKTTLWVLGAWLCTVGGLAHGASLPRQDITAHTSEARARWASWHVTTLDFVAPLVEDVAAPTATKLVVPADAGNTTKPPARPGTWSSSRWVAVIAITAVLAAIALAARRRLVFGKRS